MFCSLYFLSLSFLPSFHFSFSDSLITLNTKVWHTLRHSGIRKRSSRDSLCCVMLPSLLFFFFCTSIFTHADFVHKTRWCCDHSCVQVVRRHEQLQGALRLNFKRGNLLDVFLARIGVLQLVVKVLADLLENRCADFREANLAAVGLREESAVAVKERLGPGGTSGFVDSTEKQWLWQSVATSVLQTTVLRTGTRTHPRTHACMHEPTNERTTGRTTEEGGKMEREVT